MRLINAETFSRALQDFCKDLIERKVMNVDVVDIHADIQKLLSDTSTAYDTEKVIRQLNDRSTLSRPVGWSKAYEIITLEDAIEIVRAGGED